MMNSWHRPRITTPRTLKPLNFYSSNYCLKQYISLNERAKRRKGKEVKTTTDNSNQTANVETVSSGIVKSLKSQLIFPPAGFEEASVTGLTPILKIYGK